MRGRSAAALRPLGLSVIRLPGPLLRIFLVVHLPRSHGQFVERGEVGRMWITIAAGLVPEIPEMLHQNGTQRVHRFMPIEAFGKETSDGVGCGYQTLGELVLNHRVSDGVCVKARQLYAPASVILAD